MLRAEIDVEEVVMSNLRIKDCYIITMKAEEELITRGEVALEGDKISYVGEVRENVDDKNFDQVIYASGKVCLPGFINTHTHSPMILFRSFADDLPLMTWLEEKIWPLEDKLTSEDVYWSTLLAIVEMIKSGTTTFNDMYFFMDDMVRAVEESGIRAVLARGLIGLEGKGEVGLKETEDFITRWHNSCQGRIKAMLGPHAPYTCPPEFFREVLAKASKHKLPLHTHLAETSFEVQHCKDNYDKTPVELMDQVGLFDFPVIVAHCVHLTEEDMELMADKKVKVSHNPGSNLKLASGIAPLASMLGKGIEVSLGTDSAASNNNLDLLEEMRLAALIHKARENDPTVIPAYKALEMATREGAKGLFMEEEIGILQEGFKGDLILMDFQKPHLYPQHDLVAHLVYSAQSSDVDTVVIDGEILMENREMKGLDEERIMFNAQKQALELIRR